MRQTKKLVPELRFPEFKEIWNESKFKDLVKINQGLQIPISKRYTEPKEGLMFYITNEFLNPKSNKRYFIKNASDSVICNEDDILMTRTGNTGKVVTDVNGVFHNNFFKISYPDHINKLFLYNFLNHSRTQNIIIRLAGTSTIPDLNHSDFYKIKFIYPSNSEQQKIADFLSQVDTKLDLLSQKLDHLEQYKKGVMQKLFSQEVRFKPEDGSDYPEWVEKRLGEILKYYDGTHQTPKYVSEGIPFYSVEHVTSNQFTKTKYISEEVFKKENKKVKLERGDILMTRIGDIGTSKIIDWDVNASFYVSLALLKQNDSFNSGYLNQYVSSVTFQKELWRRTIHVAFPKKINLGEIGNCKVKLPSMEEQTKIANYLSAIDQKISFTQQQLEQTQKFKKGLLQKMFV